MATAEEVNNMLTLAAEATNAAGQAIQPFSFTAIETDSMASVDIEELKPIIMTMANMGAVTEPETHVEVSTVSTQAEDIVFKAESVLSDHLTGNDREIREVFVDDSSGVTYEVIRGGTKRGGDRLIDSLGFTYNLKQNKSTKNVSYWWCSVRNSHLRCPAAVIQKNGRFFRGKRKHEHNIGVSTPKTDTGIVSKGQRKAFGRHNVVLSESEMKRMGNSRDYRVISGGSKAGMDLLRDSNGYTYTLKKSAVDGWKKSWRCSVRNRLLQCAAVVVQYGQQFVPGNVDHGHLPGLNRPLGPNDIVPPQPRGRGIDSGADYEDEELEDDEDEERDPKSVFKSGKSTRYISQRNRSLMRLKKRRSHPTFLGPSCTINLTKCEDAECNCKLVHCPFCDKLHFKPAKAGRVQDHLEMTHFAHGVQFDDLMIVKCFQDCNLERSYGHYHCVFCFQQILKRNAYARHMLRHLRQMGIPDRLLVLPDSKFPDVINAYGYEIPICKKTVCQSSAEKHYHCPSCNQLCLERSLTVNHLWRCLQRKENAASGTALDVIEDPEEEMLNTIDESQLILHKSHIKSFKDLPLTKCTSRSCCDQKYHCQLCPEFIFHPTYRQHLVAHYVTHWKQRVPYKGLNILKCFLGCDGIDRSMLKTRYHFHCPICAKIICTKGSFQDHLISCHMLKFGENLLNQDLEQLDNTLEEDLFMSQETAPLRESIDRMEEKVTSQAVANEIGSQLAKIGSRRSYSGRGKSSRSLSLKSTVAEIRENLARTLGQGDQGAGDGDDGVTLAAFKKPGVDLSNIKSHEIFELSSAVVSGKFVQALQSRDILTSVLSKVSEMTNTKVGEVPKNNKYLLSGRVEDLLSAQQMLVELIDKMKKDDKSGKSPGRGRGRPRKQQVEQEEEEDEEHVVEEVDQEEAEEDEEEEETSKTTRSSATRGSKAQDKSVATSSAVKRGRGRPRKSDSGEKFPYSEIKEIIAANKKSESESKGRGRPPVKKTPAKAIKTRRMADSLLKEQAETPSTPSRYGTRGIKRNYVEMNAGIFKEIKKEPISDVEDDGRDDVDGDDDESDSFESVSMMPKDAGGKSKKTEQMVEKPVKRGRGRPKKVRDDTGVEEEELNDEDDETKPDGTSAFAENGQEDGANTKISVIVENMSEGIDDDDYEEMEITIREDDLNATENQEKDEDEEEEESGPKITDSAIKRLKTSNVSTSVPQVFKIGIRSRNVGKKKTDGADNGDDEIDLEMEKVRQTLNLTCSLCDDHMEESFSDLTQHLRSVHGVHDPPRCDLCEIDFDNTATLQQHLFKRHGPKTEPVSFVCQYDDCGKVFTTQNGLTGHINRVHIGIEGTSHGTKKYSCESCSYKSNSMEDLCEHKKVAHGEKIECDICHKQFGSYFNLKSHKEVKHSSSGVVSCDICFKKFSHVKYLRRHTQVHYTEQFMCHVCSKTLSNKASLRAHLETHKPDWERKYKYECEYCDKKFMVKSNYSDHLNKHTGLKPYKCDVCSRAFGFRSMMMKHKLFVHSNERPFKCGVCMKSFKFMNLLQNHLSVHTNRSKHVCDLCSKNFTTASTLKYHQRKCKGSKISYSQLGTRVGGSTYVLITDPTDTGNGGNQTRLVEVSDPGMSSLATVTGHVAPAAQELQYTVMLDGPQDKVDSLGMTSLLPDPQTTLGAQTTIEAQTAVDPQTILDPQTTLLPDESTSVVSEETVEVPMPTDPGQLFACSECSVTFGSYSEAETHVLTAHQAPVMPDETMEVLVEETTETT